MPFYTKQSLTWAVFLATVLTLRSAEVIQEAYPNTMEDEKQWSNIPMPEVSYFEGFGFKAPSDKEIWARAKQNAISGKQILLHQVFDTIKTPGSLLRGEVAFGLVKGSVDVHLSKRTGFKPFLKFNDARVPIALFGLTREVDMKPFPVYDVMDYMKEYAHEVAKFSPPQGFIGVGSMDENWGYFSSYFLNRTTTWSYTLNRKIKAIPTNGQMEDVESLLALDKLIMMVVNQHTNISHPKVISRPLGINYRPAVVSHSQGLQALASDVRVTNLMLAATSEWGPRPYTLKCVMAKMGDSLQILTRVNQKGYANRLIDSATVLCLPGLGFDTYRVLESLMAGSIPVMERGIGLDRTYHRLPVLFVDDYSHITPSLLRQAYVEALYHAENGEWEYQRMTQAWWESLILDTSVAGNISILMERHPMPKYPGDVHFVRPFTPFTCGGKYGATKGCGPGTHRTPNDSCAIDFKTDFNNYHWNWELDAKKEIQRQAIIDKVKTIKNNNKLRREINEMNNGVGTQI